VKVDAKFGRLGALVNNAGVVQAQTRVESMRAERLERVFAVNVIGPFLCAREAVRRMSTRRGGKGGAIVNVSSMAATLGGRPGSSAYAATKGAVDSFTKAFAREVAAEGIRVNSIRPGMVLSEMTEKRRGVFAGFQPCAGAQAIGGVPQPILKFTVLRNTIEK